jgi:hypothetical protein
MSFSICILHSVVMNNQVHIRTSSMTLREIVATTLTIQARTTCENQLLDYYCELCVIDLCNVLCDYCKLTLVMCFILCLCNMIFLKKCL